MAPSTRVIQPIQWIHTIKYKHTHTHTDIRVREGAGIWIGRVKGRVGGSGRGHTTGSEVKAAPSSSSYQTAFIYQNCAPLDLSGHEEYVPFDL